MKKKGPSSPKLGKGEGGVRVVDAAFVAGAARRDQMPKTEDFEGAPEIAFAGRSNVGKSSLLNMILSRKGLARTSGTPGCTRQINFFSVQIAQKKAGVLASGSPSSSGVDGPSIPSSPTRFVFVDLPGYGYAKVSKSEAAAWKELLEGYLHLRSTLRAVVVLVDVRRGFEQEEEDLVEFLAARPAVRVVVVATKLDKLSRSAQKPALAKLALTRAGTRLDVVATSAETGEGREALWSRIIDACRID